ncbi:MAG: ankyrin repeat domain-containing protein, partial [Lachnospiraceae bacterium]|nr:ankyrin repeat domain-containing protein [Lachnospiraceae bacterium]
MKRQGKIVKAIISLIIFLILRYHSIYYAIDSDNSFLLNLTSKYNFMINLRPVPELPIIMAIFEHNETPLVYAIKRDKYNSVNVLLNNGADPNAL